MKISKAKVNEEMLFKGLLVIKVQIKNINHHPLLAECINKQTQAHTHTLI